MKARLFIVALALTAIVATSTLTADDKKKVDPLKDVKCPVSGKAVVADKAVAYKGAKVYFCCAGCPSAFKKNTAKFAAKANHQLVATGQAKEVKCPLKDKRLNPQTVIDVAGVKVCFCCGGCKAKALRAKGDAQIELVFNDKAFKTGFKIAKPKKGK